MKALSPAERRACVEVLAGAFRDNPLNAAVIAPGDPVRRLRANRHSLRVLLPSALDAGAVHVAREQDRIAGVLLGAGVGGFPFPSPPAGARLRSILGQGLGVALRWGRVFDHLLARHPPFPHAYLATVGVAPGAQGRGIGGRLVAQWLLDVDDRGHAAYLETDRERNLGLYVRHGFRVWAETEVLGVRIWQMIRDARQVGVADPAGFERV